MKTSSWTLLVAILISTLLATGSFAWAQKDAAPPSSKQAPSAAPLNDEDIPDAYLEEADQFFKYCGASPEYNKYYNCECLAAQYLDERIKSGPDLDRTSILLAIGKGCADGTNAAGSHYKMCLGSGLMLPKNISAEDYCTCYANAFAKIYEESGASPSSDLFVQIQTAAHMRCRSGT